MDRSKVGELMVIAGNSHPELAELIAKYISHSFLSKYWFSILSFRPGVWGSKLELLQFITKLIGKRWLILLTLSVAKMYTLFKQELSTEWILFSLLEL